MTVATLESVVQQANGQILSMSHAVLPKITDPRSLVGISQGKPISAEKLKSCLPSRLVPQKGGGTKAFPLPLAVIARIDQWSRQQTHDLPVVVAVGINPGDAREQNRAVSVAGIYAQTELRPRLEEAFTLALASAPSTGDFKFVPTADKYHLIVVYLFPWLTEKTWQEMKLNPLEECLLLYGFGSSDLLLSVKKLVADLTASEECVEWVVFHGSSPAIPLMASIYAQQRKPCDPDVLITDDLAGTAPIVNSVVLGRPKFERHLVEEMNVDE